jgi:hypothetical protein
MSQIAARNKGIVKVYACWPFQGEGHFNDILLNDFVRGYFLPYCFQRMYKDEDITNSRYYGSNLNALYPYTYLPLNRRYKPIGFVTNDHVKYEDYPLNIIRSKKPFFKIKNVFTNKTPITQDTKQFWLYNDGIESRVNYCARLEHLMKYVAD